MADIIEDAVRNTRFVGAEFMVIFSTFELSGPGGLPLALCLERGVRPQCGVHQPLADVVVC